MGLMGIRPRKIALLVMAITPHSKGRVKKQGMGETMVIRIGIQEDRL